MAVWLLSPWCSTGRSGFAVPGAAAGTSTWLSPERAGSVEPRGKSAGCAECARDGQSERFHKQVQSRQIECPGPLHQLTRNSDRHLGMTLPLELNSRPSPMFVGVV